MNQLGIRILGFALVFWGVRIWLNPMQYSSKYHWIFDYSEIRVSFSGMLIIVGILFLWTTYRKE